MEKGEFEDDVLKGELGGKVMKGGSENVDVGGGGGRGGGNGRGGGKVGRGR